MKLWSNSHPRVSNKYIIWAVVVAQLVEQSLPIPEVRGSNPVIGKNLSKQNGVSERSELTPF